MKTDTIRAAARDALDVIECLRVAFPSTVGNLALGDTTDALRRELQSDSPIVHVLHHGATLCELRAPPNTWPKGELWVPVLNQVDATCPECKAADLL